MMVEDICVGIISRGCLMYSSCPYRRYDSRGIGKLYLLEVLSSAVLDLVFCVYPTHLYMSELVPLCRDTTSPRGHSTQVLASRTIWMQT